MNHKKISIGIIFGGMSAEHEVSIESAKATYSNLDRSRFDPLLIYINPGGNWCRMDGDTLLKTPSYKGSELLSKARDGFHSFTPWESGVLEPFSCDIYFPVLHGPNGEDGRIQGLLELAGAPYVGASSFSSALAMNKAAAKMMFQCADLDTPRFVYFRKNDRRKIIKETQNSLRLPVFVKPNSLGSSVGITKVKCWDNLEEAVRIAFRYDTTVIIEEGIDAHEIEVSVMGNQAIKVSRPGELIPHNEFYDYADKYLDNQTRFHIPAELDLKIEETICSMARRAFQALFLNGLSRIDFFLEKKTDRVFINEINTIPGFTEISMFPKLWQLEGISFTDLITRLIEYGFEYYRETRNQETGLRSQKVEE